MRDRSNRAFIRYLVVMLNGIADCGLWRFAQQRQRLAAASGADIGSTNGNTATCTITGGGQTASFVGVSAGN